MSNPQISTDVNFLDGIDYSEFRKFGAFVAGTFITEEVGANATEQFPASEQNALVQSVDIQPDFGELPKVARLISAKINISQGSTDSTVAVYQSDGYEEINQVISVSKLSQSSTPETYMLGSGLGTPFINKEGENQVHFEIQENSGNASTYEIELVWANIPK